MIYTLLGKIHKEVDLDWQEIADNYQVDCSVDSLRKYAKGIQWCEEAGLLGEQNPIAYVTQVQDDGTAERMALLQARDLRREINEHYRAEARSDALCQAVIQAAQAMPPMEVRTPILDPVGTGERAMVVPIADCHYGAEWEIKGLKGELINRYDPEIFEKRMGELLERVVEAARETYTTRLVVLMGGDSLDGILRPSQLVHLRYGIVDAAMRYAEYMTNWIDKLTSRGFMVDVYNVNGNHTEIRPLGSKRGDFPNENMERIITWYMAARLKDNGRVHIQEECKKYQLLDVCGFNVVLCHGDDMKDVTGFARDMMLLYQTPVHYFYCGHKHTGEGYMAGTTADGNSEVIRIPSICGVDYYANSLHFGGRAGTRLDLFEREYGIAKIYPIWLNE